MALTKAMSKHDPVQKQCKKMIFTGYWEEEGLVLTDYFIYTICSSLLYMYICMAFFLFLVNICKKEVINRVIICQVIVERGSGLIKSSFLPQFPILGSTKCNLI